MRRWLAIVVCGLAAGACTGEPSMPSITQEGTRPPSRASTTVADSVAPSVGLTTTSTATAAQDERTDERLAMVRDQIDGRGVDNPVVLKAMEEVPRHRFVPDGYQRSAYGDHPLPIGHGQTISQPYIVALMSAVLEVEPGDKVLEIGTGSGYQAGVLAEMGLEVYTIEIISELAEGAGSVLAELGYDVAIRTADGYFGWEEEAPFDAIIVTAAPDHVPQPLISQLAPGSVMVIPVGPIGAVQTLWRFALGPDGDVQGTSLGPVSFVPFTRAEE